MVAECPCSLQNRDMPNVEEVEGAESDDAAHVEIVNE
jgi:hypothetical protein